MIELSPIRNGGGPAFPTEATSATFFSLGMTKRDYFAAKAMQTMLGTRGAAYLNQGGYETISMMAYRMADALLDARKA